MNELRVLVGAHQGPDFGVPAATVRSWARRRRLHTRGLDNFGRPLYSLADVLALAASRRVGVAA